MSVLSCPADVAQRAEPELRPDLDVAAQCHVCMLMFTATVDQQVDPSDTEL